MTDQAIVDVLGEENTEIIWKPETFLPEHPNGMIFEALSNTGDVTATYEVYSIGGGALLEKGKKTGRSRQVYPFKNMAEILEKCDEEGTPLWEYVNRHEDETIWEYLKTVWQVMDHAIERGLKEEGTLPGSLHLQRKASSYFTRAQSSRGYLNKTGLTFAYALAVSEENAACSEIVTAPTCGSAGVLPAVLKFNQKYYKFSEDKILRALATAGLIGNLVKRNASISGAEVGCQGEVGTACAMAAGAATQLLGGSPHQIEYAAEMGLEHHLGLTCDPIDGLVQIPCIERNAIAAVRALDCASYVLLSDGRHRISFDEVVITMAQTGHDLNSAYRETSEGGLAHFHGRALKRLLNKKH
jgi:L-serine dehydratase